MSENLINMITFIAATQGLVLSGILFFSKKHNKHANKYLAAFLFISSVMIFRQLFEALQMIQSLTFLYMLTWAVTILFGPFIYFYIILTIKPDYSTADTFYKHYTVPTIYFLYMLIGSFYGLGSVARVKADPVLFYSYLFFQFVLIIQILIYLLLSLRAILNYRKKVKEQYLDINKTTLRWLQYFLIATLVLYFEWVIVLKGDLILYTNVFPNPSYYMTILRGMFVLLVYLAGYFAILKPEIFIKQTIKEAPKTLNRFDESTLKTYRASLMDLMDSSKPYLNPTLSITDLAKEMNLSSKIMSQIINDGFQKTFHDFVNEYRVEEVKLNLLDSENQNLTIEAIASKSGFNSSSTLNRLFKKYTGLTPKQYKKSNSD